MPVTDEMVCFSLYAATRATTQAYRTLLEPWGLTYPQYLVLVTLWVEGDQTVSSLGDHLQLDSGTLSPLLKRMEQADLVRRERRSTDERVVTVTTGERGRSLRTELAHVPAAVAAGTGLADERSAAELIATLQRLTETMHRAATTSAPGAPAAPSDPAGLATAAPGGTGASRPSA
ncbi:MarR family winged helix-turn-helix transcriptional regulator [Curtobacterium aetherium]|uniref:MarR family winged helix-turn-helix transcriptional regulator n=1 Tax=Curtobacterium aetherium TaxID=2841594 RepID=UPI003B51D277